MDQIKDTLTSEEMTSEEKNAAMGARTLGRAAFDGYSVHTHGRTYDGRQIPRWTALPDQVKEAWEAAARAVTARCGNCPKSAEESQ